MMLDMQDSLRCTIAPLCGPESTFTLAWRGSSIPSGTTQHLRATLFPQDTIEASLRGMQAALLRRRRRFSVTARLRACKPNPWMPARRSRGLRQTTKAVMYVQCWPDPLGSVNAYGNPTRTDRIALANAARLFDAS